MISGDEYSDLTDIDELSEEYEAQPAKRKGKGKGKAKAVAGEYRIRHALKAPRATTYSTEALYKQIHNGDINLEPEYQREVVWPEAKQIGIIDSIFRNFYIPPVIFAVNAFDDGTETRTCIDGKQRLTSIHRFMQGLIPHKDAITGDKLWYQDNPAHRTKTAKKILPEKYRNMFDTKAVVCVEYQDIKDADEREIFQRVQLGVALTPAEKLKVLTTARARFVRDLQDVFLNNESSGLGGDALAWDRSRGSDFRCLAQTIQCIAISPKTTSIQATEKWLADPSPMAPGFAEGIENTYRVFEALARRSANVFTAPAKIAPVEFIAVGILVHRHKHKLTLGGLADAVSALRVDVRKVHDDIRNNGKVYKTMSSFIDRYKGPPPVRGEVCAADAVGSGAGIANASAKTSAGNAAKAGTKRKAAARVSDDDESSDDDYAPSRATRKRASPTKATAPKPAAPPTPPTSTATSAPPAGTPPAGGVSEMLQTAKQRIDAARASGVPVAVAQGHSLPQLPSPGLPFSFNPDLPQNPYFGQQQQQQQHHGAASVAAALEAGLMGNGNGGGSGWGGTPPGARVKQEQGAGPPPFSGGSADSGRYSSHGGSGSYGRDRGWDRDRDYAGSGYEYDREKRYRESSDRGGGSSRGRRY
ncbi:hypothetical protein C8R44DRAFT_974158 [Mycena epipterygia]|nr:hypothetical protein C8R44DRAFT_974158 [Mycena epipterygia]